MTETNKKNESTNFKHTNDKFNVEAAQELGIPLPNTNLPTAKIIYAYELGLNNKL